MRSDAAAASTGVQRLSHALALPLLGLLTIQPAAALETQPYLGTVALVASVFCPVGTLAADGHMLQIADHQTLFTLIGTTYGSQDNWTFALPDLMGKAPDGMLYCIVVDGDFPPRP